MREEQRNTSGADLSLAAVLAEAEEILAAARRVPAPERVLATVLFCDIVDSTGWVAELGDERWAELLATYHAILRQELVRHRGTEMDTAGDGCFAAFESPSLALRCAKALQAAVAPLGLRLRVGLHTGECQRLGAKLAGIAVHIGARTAAMAQAGEVLVSGTVHDVVAGAGFAFAERGTHSLAGVPGEWPMYALAAGLH